MNLSGKLEIVGNAGQALAERVEFSTAGAVFLTVWGIATLVVLFLYYKIEGELNEN